MAIEEGALRALQQHLEEALGVDDASGIATVLRSVATKDDIAELRRDLGRFATKADLERFATKADLERYATKADLERFATKADLERFATKDDLVRLELRMDAKLAELLATVRGEFVTQLRAMFLGLVTVLVAIAGLGVTLATTL